MSSIGIDISQNTFDATMITSQGTRPHRQFANTQKGFQQFHAWVKPRPLKEFHVCMEATNIYWEELAEYLQSDPQANTVWAAMSYIAQLRTVTPINNAKKPETRQRNVEKVIAQLRGEN